jgi:hypothetical protein
MLAVSEGWRVELDVERIEVDSELPGRFAPARELEGAELDNALTVPPTGQGYAEVLYAAGVTEASVRCGDGDRVTRVLWDGDFLRYLWIVTVSGAVDLDLCLLLEPCTTRPYRLEEAIVLGEHRTLAAGEQRAWWVEMEALDSMEA